MITCPECSTEYEKEAKYCFKCRIPFTDDIPENIKKYLKPRAGFSTTRSNTIPLSSNAVDKPPLQRNVSLPVFKNNNSNSNNSFVNNSFSSSNNLNSNNILISSSSPPNNSNSLINNSNSHSSNNLISPTSSSGGGVGNRPRMQSTPTPPSHPLPPVPNRMSVPIANSPPTVMNTRQPPPPPSNANRPPATNTSNTTPTNTTPTTNVNRTISPITTMTSPDNNMSPQMGFTDEHPSNNFIKRPLSRRIPPPPPNKKLVRAVWDCVPEQEGDLEFYVGDIISVITKDDESGWWMGTLNGRTGLFPANYVEEMDS